MHVCDDRFSPLLGTAKFAFSAKSPFPQLSLLKIERERAPPKKGED